MKTAAMIFSAFLLTSGVCSAAEVLESNPTWQAPSAAQVRPLVLEWLAAQPAAEPARKQLEALWPDDGDEAPPAELLERLAQSFALADDQARALFELCGRPNSTVLAPDFGWLLDDAAPPLVRHNLRLYLARWLAQHELHDEALLYLEGLEPDDVVDPATLLFYQAVAHHRLVSMEEGRTMALRLLEREEELPQRYRQLARLMADDLQEVKVDSLDHIARRMNDIRRRLDLGRAGPKVREVEDGVIASLDKLIKELEDQQQQQEQQSSSGQGAQSSTPAQDSRIMTQKGPGNVDRKDIGSKSGWGSLPPKDREEALQQIGKEFPSHFRDIIEQFFRKIPSEEESGN